MIERLLSALDLSPQALAAWAVGIAVVTIVLSVAAALLALVRLPPDYLVLEKAPGPWLGRHPLLRVVLIAGKNLLGLLLVAVGLVLSIPGVPGQGLLTLLVGVLLVDFPGKRRLERRVLGRDAVLRRINLVRERFRRPPLEAPRTPELPGTGRSD